MLFFNLSLSLFLLTPRIKYLLKFSQTLLQSCLSASVVHSITNLLYLFSPSLIARYYLTYIHHTLRVTWGSSPDSPLFTLLKISPQSSKSRMGSLPGFNVLHLQPGPLGHSATQPTNSTIVEALSRVLKYFLSNYSILDNNIGARQWTVGSQWI